MNFSHITWLDDKGRIKPPIYLYLILAFIARGWCVLIISLTQSSDRAGLVALFIPKKRILLWPYWQEPEHYCFILPLSLNVSDPRIG